MPPGEAALITVNPALIIAGFSGRLAIAVIVVLVVTGVMSAMPAVTLTRAVTGMTGAITRAMTSAMTSAMTRTVTLPVSAMVAVAVVGDSHGARRHNRGNCMFVNHLIDAVAQQHDKLIEGLDLSLQFDAIDEEYRHRHALFAQDVEERVL